MHLPVSVIDFAFKHLLIPLNVAILARVMLMNPAVTSDGG